MKKVFSLAMAALMVFGTLLLGGCGGDETVDESAISYVHEYSKDYAGTEINVYNWGEYISDGAEGTLDVNLEFEKLTGIKVNYSNYDTNESLYAKLKSGGVNYDIVIPSDYMIERLINEGMVQKLNMANIPNASYIADEYKGMYFDAKDEYSVPYCVGMVGLIYNTTMVEGTPDSWSVMWDEKYKDNILTFNNSRDAFGVAQYLLGLDVNSSNPADWEKAAEKLKEQKPLIQSYVMDDVFAKMESGEAAMAPYYAGDYLTMVENNPDLAFVYPKEGTNIFVDSICIPTGSTNKEAAEMYIDFLCEPEIALANAEAIYYASPNTAVMADDNYSVKGSEILYPSAEVKANAQYFQNLDPETLALLASLWEQVKLAK